MLDLTAPMEKYRDPPDITHMDLYYPGHLPSDASLITDCVLIDLAGGAENVDLKALPALGLVEKGNSVILRTGWEEFRGTPKYADSPSVDQGLIQCLVEKGVVLVLIDSPGVCGGAKGPEHNAMDKYLADHRAYAVENLVNVGKITRPRFGLYCFPLPMTALNSAPCRVVANIPDQ
jgi:kynurenine formamidase